VHVADEWLHQSERDLLLSAPFHLCDLAAASVDEVFSLPPSRSRPLQLWRRTLPRMLQRFVNGLAWKQRVL